MMKITAYFRFLDLIPFDVALPANKPLDLSSLSAAELSEELEEGYADMKA